MCWFWKLWLNFFYKSWECVEKAGMCRFWKWYFHFLIYSVSCFEIQIIKRKGTDKQRVTVDFHDCKKVRKTYKCADFETGGWNFLTKSWECVENVEMCRFWKWCFHFLISSVRLCWNMDSKERRQRHCGKDMQRV